MQHKSALDNEPPTSFRHFPPLMNLATEGTLSRRPYSVDVDRRELLPFTVRLSESPQDLCQVVEIRSSAFARHLPSQGAALSKPEADDEYQEVLLLLAERKLDGRVLGSMRLQPNTRRPLRIESVTELPEPYVGSRLVEFMRLGVENGLSGQMVMAALAKASFEICHAADMDYIVAVGRRTTSVIYRSMQFDDVLDGRKVRVPHAGNLEHSVYCLPIAGADRRWRQNDHALYTFMARTVHPDIAIDFARVREAFACPV